MGRGHLPYRGEPQPKYPKPKKQIRNLRQERIIRFLILGICVLIMTALISIMISTYRADAIDFTLTFVIGLVTLLILFITVSVADGIKNVNRFRKGYDIDISGESKGKDGEQTEDLNEQ